MQGKKQRRRVNRNTQHQPGDTIRLNASLHKIMIRNTASPVSYIASNIVPSLPKIWKARSPPISDPAVCDSSIQTST